MRVGIAATVAVWLTAAWSVPLVNEYRQFNPETLLIVRGVAVMVAVLIFVFSGKGIWISDKSSVYAGICLAIASVTFFRGVNVWGANPTITVLTLTPVVNFVCTVVREKKFPWIAFASLVAVLGGVACALQPWKDPLHPQGLEWALCATLTAGMGFEFWGKTRATLSAKFFWYSFFAIIFAYVTLKLIGGKFELLPPGMKVRTAVYVFVVIGGLGGITYIGASSVVLEKLPTVLASVLLQGETPAVIIGSAILVGIRPSGLQWFGIFCALVGIGYLIYKTDQLSKKEEKAKLLG